MITTPVLPAAKERSVHIHFARIKQPAYALLTLRYMVHFDLTSYMELEGGTIYEAKHPFLLSSGFMPINWPTTAKSFTPDHPDELKARMLEDFGPVIEGLCRSYGSGEMAVTVYDKRRGGLAWFGVASRDKATMALALEEMERHPVFGFEHGVNLLPDALSRHLAA